MDFIFRYPICLSLTGCADRDSGFHQGTQKQDISQVCTMYETVNEIRTFLSMLKKALENQNSLKPSFKRKVVIFFKVKAKNQKFLVFEVKQNLK